jgi:hypothetical protein
MYCVPENIRESLGHSYLTQPIAAISSLVANKDTRTLEEPWNPDIVALIGRGIYEHMVCMQAWKVIPASLLVAILDTVRTRVLNFALEIETQNPSAGEAMLDEKPLPPETVQQIFNTYISGDVQNLASGSTNVSQSATWQEGIEPEIFSKLLDAVLAANLPNSTREEVSDAIKDLRAAHGSSRFKEQYLRFMGIVANHIQVLGPVMAPFLTQLGALLP